MRNYLLTFFILLSLGAMSQKENSKISFQKAQWPIKGKSAGEGIVGKPGQSIKGEKNYNELFIEGKEGDLVVAPVDGVVKSFGYKYSESLSYSYSFGFEEKTLKESSEADIKKAMADNLIKKNRQLKGGIARYVSLTLGIETKSGETYYISSLGLVKPFRTGEKITKGDVIGKVSYAYHAFSMPHIELSRTIDTKGADPMSVFGLETSFKKVVGREVNVFKDIIPADTLKRTFAIIRSSLEEIHPGLYDYTSKREMDSLFDVAKKQLKPMSCKEFTLLFKSIMQGIADSHTEMSFTFPLPIKKIPPVLLTLDGEKAFVVNALPKVGLKKGDEIVAVGGKSISEWVSNIKKTMCGFEGYNRLYIDRYLAEDLSIAIYKKFFPAENSLTFKTATGKQVVVAYASSQNYMKFKAQNRLEPAPYSFKMLKPNVAYLSIGTFQLTDVETDSIEAIVGRIQKQNISNFIVDVRDNGGGSIKVGNRILSFLLTEPKKMFAYRMVNTNGIYSTLKYSDNWDATHPPFPEFKAEVGKKGCYSYVMEVSTDSGVVQPSIKTNFGGKLYILANEMSISMASDFAGALLGQRNCTIVGRETGSSYYQMNAERFANIILPQVGLSLRIPMVKIVINDIPNPRIPYGRGVIPDYEVPIGAQEFLYKKDVILSKALELIVK